MGEGKKKKDLSGFNLTCRGKLVLHLARRKGEEGRLFPAREKTEEIGKREGESTSSAARRWEEEEGSLVRRCQGARLRIRLEKTEKEGEDGEEKGYTLFILIERKGGVGISTYNAYGKKKEGLKGESRRGKEKKRRCVHPSIVLLKEGGEGGEILPLPSGAWREKWRNRRTGKGRRKPSFLFIAAGMGEKKGEERGSASSTLSLLSRLRDTLKREGEKGKKKRGEGESVLYS